LQSAGIHYMVTGSIALNFYSVPRMTRDIDLVIELSLPEVDRFCNLFSKDFYLSKEAVEGALKRRGVFNLIHNESIVKVDFIVRKEGEYHREEFRRRRPVNLEGTTIFLVSPEDLILSKLLWARDTDSEVQLKDVRNLPHSLKDLDRPYLQRQSLFWWEWPCHLPGVRGSLRKGTGGTMKDTAPEVAELFHNRLMALSGEKRLKMGCSMYETARRLVLASLKAQDPHISPTELRKALFLRLYGRDFEPETITKILTALGQGRRP